MTKGKFFGSDFLDLFQHVEVQALLAGELERAVRRADGHGQRVAAALFDELGRLVRIGQAHAADDVFLDAAELAQFGLDDDALGMGPIDHAAGDLDVLLELLVRGVDHHRAVEAAVDAVVADFFGAVIEMDGENHLRKDLVGRADHRFQESLVGVASRAAGNLQNERGALGRVDRVVVRLRLAQIATEQADRLFQVVDVVRPDGVFAVGVLKKLFRRNDHGITQLLGGGSRASLTNR